MEVERKMAVKDNQQAVSAAAATVLFMFFYYYFYLFSLYPGTGVIK